MRDETIGLPDLHIIYRRTDDAFDIRLFFGSHGRTLGISRRYSLQQDYLLWRAVLVAPMPSTAVKGEQEDDTSITILDTYLRPHRSLIPSHRK